MSAHGQSFSFGRALMRNEYKAWLWDKVQEVVKDRGLADVTFNSDERFVEGLKDGEPVRFEVWFDLDLGNWRVERRELEK